jgi:hypothetical protein
VLQVLTLLQSARLPFCHLALTLLDPSHPNLMQLPPNPIRSFLGYSQFTVSRQLYLLIQPSSMCTIVNREFLFLPAYDHFPGSDYQFGYHHETLVTACTILAYNRPGYISTSRHRNNGTISLPMNPFLQPGRYYFHLANTAPQENYPICCDFRKWTFPHGKLPPSWLGPPLQEDWDLMTGSTTVSQRIKVRDKVCLITGSVEYLTASHVVPKDENDWVRRTCSLVHLTA